MKKLLMLIILLTAACSDEGIMVPKPPTYLRLELPEHSYTTYKGNCGYSFDAAKIFKIKDVVDSSGKQLCHKDIELGPLNGVIHFSYIEMTEPLARYVNYANDKVDEHKLKASAIEDFRILESSKKVYGTFFELQGNVASPFQFYLTDSTSRFVSGVIYFNSRPNYDSLKPSLDYLKKDLLQLIHSFQWD
jgi:gliding motility-associated lipoprotein GldD